MWRGSRGGRPLRMASFEVGELPKAHDDEEALGRGNTLPLSLGGGEDQGEEAVHLGGDRMVEVGKNIQPSGGSPQIRKGRKG